MTIKCVAEVNGIQKKQIIFFNTMTNKVDFDFAHTMKR
jgi:hypothetical protein